MRVTNPDLTRLMQLEAATSMELFGVTVDWRKYISSSGASPEFGQYDAPCYQVKRSLWQLKPMNIQELQEAGGEIYAGGFDVFTQDPIDARDEMRYNKRIYRCVTQPISQHIGADLWYRAVFGLASATAKF